MSTHKITDMPWQAFGSAITAIGSFFTNRQNNRAANKLFDKQAAFGREESQKERDWQEYMYDKNNAYNSPSAQMQRYRDAGLNPDLVYGDGSLTSPSQAPSGGAMAPTPTAAAPRFDNPFADAGQIIANKKLVDSQSRANDAKANKDNKEVEIASADLVLRKAKNESDIRLQDSTIYLNHRMGDLTHAQGEKIAAEINNLNSSSAKLVQETEVLRKSLTELDERIATIQFERFLRSQEFEQSVKESNSRIASNYADASLKGQQKRTEIYRTGEAMSKAGISEQEYRIAIATYVEQVAGVKARNQTDVQILDKVKKQLGILDMESARLQFNFDKEKQYKDAQIIMGLANNFVSSVADAVAAYRTYGLSKMLKGSKTPTATPPTWSGGVPSDPFN